MATDKDIRVSVTAKNTYATQFQRDGVLIVEGAFDDQQMPLIEAAYQHILDHPTPLTQRLYSEEGGTFIQSVDDPSNKPCFRAMFEGTPIVDICEHVFGSGGVWYFHEQLFFKDGGEKPVRRTPWHQDTPYHAVDGSKFAVFWIPLHDIAQESALEVIRGSHKQTLYNPSYFDPSDDTLPLYDEDLMPRLPHIEAERDQWDIVTCTMQRGDLLIFHPSCLHGGGAQPAGAQRRSLSLRMIGDDMVRVERPGANPDSPTAHNVGDDEEPLTARINKLAIGTPVYAAGLNRLN